MSELSGRELAKATLDDRRPAPDGLEGEERFAICWMAQRFLDWEEWLAVRSSLHKVLLAGGYCRWEVPPEIFPAWGNEVEEVWRAQQQEGRAALPRLPAVGKTRLGRVVLPADLAREEQIPWWRVARDIVRVEWQDGTVKVLVSRWPVE